MHRTKAESFGAGMHYANKFIDGNPCTLTIKYNLYVELRVKVCCLNKER